MSHCVQLLVLAASVAAALATPKSEFELDDVVTKTLCPTVVVYDTKEDRIPRVIKTIRCKDDPDEFCAANRKPEECCRRHLSGGDLVSRCVDVVDHVRVTNRDLSHTYFIKVPVGCSCLLQEVTWAQDAE